MSSNSIDIHKFELFIAHVYSNSGCDYLKKCVGALSKVNSIWTKTFLSYFAFNFYGGRHYSH